MTKTECLNILFSDDEGKRYLSRHRLNLEKRIKQMNWPADLLDKMLAQGVVKRLNDMGDSIERVLWREPKTQKT